MNIFKKENIRLATSLDYNSKCVVRDKGDGRILRRYSRRKLKQKLHKESEDT